MYHEVTIEEWKDMVSKSSHVRTGEMVEFGGDEYIIRADINLSDHRSIFLGAYCIKNQDPNSRFKVNTGWFHS
jgi:hypothetical protein